MLQDPLKRIMKYCAVSERAPHDVRQKLSEWDLPPDKIQAIMQKLADEKFIDEFRYAKTFVSEKWEINRWGRLKMEDTLHRKNITQDVIQSALNIIDEKEYRDKVEQILLKKYKELKSKSPKEDAKRLMMFAIGRG